MIQETEKESPPDWFVGFLQEQTGQSDIQSGAKIMAAQEACWILKFRGWQTFEDGVPLLDLLCLHPEIYPFFIASDDYRYGSVKSMGGEYRISLSPNLEQDFAEKQFTIAHEYAHVMIHHWGNDKIRHAGWAEEQFCDVFARHLLLPDDIVLSAIPRPFSLETVDSLMSRFKVNPDMLIDWLKDQDGLLDDLQKAVILVQDWDTFQGMPVLKSEKQALPSWGDDHLSYCVHLSKLHQDLSLPDHEQLYINTGHYITTVAGIRTELYRRSEVYDINNCLVEYKPYLLNLSGRTSGRRPYFLVIFDYPQIPSEVQKSQFNIL